MKNKLVILIAAIMVGLTSCNDKPTALYHQIERIDSLIMWKNESLAKKIYDSLDISMANENDAAYYNLIKLKLDYQKAATATMDSIFDLTEHYYSHNRDKRKLVQTLFYRSDYYFNNNNYFKSQEYLSKAEEIAIDNSYYLELSLINWMKIPMSCFNNPLETSKVYSDRQLKYALLSHELSSVMNPVRSRSLI